MPLRLALLFLACFFLPRGSLFASGFVVVIDSSFRPPPGRPAWAPLEVREHAVSTVIDGQVATTTVDQEFYNPGGRIAEATYFFPVPRDAQIEKFQLEINGKWTDPELLDATKAREIYEDIVRRAKDPALLEYAGLRLFKARLFPIEAQSTRRIRLSYREVLPLDFGALTWRYPFAEKGGTPKKASVRVEIKAERAWASVFSPSHPVTVKPDADGRRTLVEWESRDGKQVGDFELICTPRPGKADDVGLTMFTYREPGAGDDEDGWFALFAAPPPERAGSDAKPAPKDVIFVLDTSGSMAGPKIAQARKALTFCVDRLNDGDHFDVIRFSSESEALFGKLTESTPDSRKRAQDFIGRLRAAGGTAIHDALRTALAARPDAKAGRPFIVVFLTDGLANIGPSRNEDILALVKTGAGAPANARVFTFGIGNDVNTHLLDLLAEQTRAASQYVLPEEDIEVKVSNFFAKVTEPALTDLRVELRGGGDGARLSQWHPSALPDLFAGDQLVLAGRFRGRGDAEVVLRGRRGGADREFVAKVSLDGGKEREFIPRLWATRRVAFLLDEIRLRGETAEVRDEVTRLARKYGLVTPYTAYLILEDEARRDVPATRRTLGQFEKDKDARGVFAESYNGLKKEETGAGAVRGALAQEATRNAALPGAAMDSANSQIFGRARSAPAKPGLAPPGTATIDRLERQTAQAARFVAGRAFFQNGAQWVDAGIQARARASAEPRRIAFNTPAYFQLLRDHPEAAPWLALGPNVLLTLGNADYEIYE